MPTPQETEAEVRDAVLAFFRAGSEPGMEAVDATLALLADDYTGFGTGPNDYYPDRASFGAHILRERALMPTASTFEVAWMRVRELRPGLALVAVQVRFSIAMGGQTHVVEPLGTIVLERRDGRWLFAHFHFALGNAAQQEGDTLLHALQDRNRQLEEEVARRTAELEGTLAELRATQSRLVQQEKLAGLGRLTAGIAHEIKNPLNFVNNFAALSVELADEADEALAAPTPDTAEARALLADLRVNAERVVEHGRRADSIVRAMMQHARGGTEPVRRVEVNALVEEHLRFALDARGDEEPGVEAVRAYDPAAGEVEAVPQELGRVVVNLISNALDAVTARAAEARGEPYAPRVVVRTERAGGAVRIVVADNGVGLPAGAEGRLFEPFYTTKPTGQGNVGLGLSLARDAVAALGGEIEVESREGSGATFIVTIPGVVPGDAASVEPSRV